MEYGGGPEYFNGLGGAGAAMAWGLCGGPGHGVSPPSRGLEAFLQRDWQNVQDNVKGAFFFLASVLQEQAREIASLKVQVADKTTMEQVEASLSRYETKERAEATALNMKTALVDKADRSEVAGLKGSLLGGPDEIGRRVHTLQSAVEELQVKGREVEIGLESARAELKRKAAAVDELVEHAFKKADVATKAELSELRARLVLKADKDQVDSQLSRRPTWTDIEGVLRDKADIGSVERVAMQKANAVDLERLEDHVVDKVGRDEMRGLVLTELQPLLAEVRATSTKEAASATSYTTKKEEVVAAVMEALRSSGIPQGTIPTGLPSIPTVSPSDTLLRSQIQADLEINKENLLKSLESEAMRLRAEVMGDVQGELSNLQAEVSGTISLLSSKVEKFRAATEKGQVELVQVLNKKAHKVDVAASLQTKADKETVSIALEGKADKAEVEQALAGKADESEVRETLTRVMQQLSSCSRDLVDAKVEIRRDLDRMAEKLTKKADQDDLQAVRVSTVGSNDWRVAVGEISLNLRRELAEKPSREEVLAAMGRELTRLEEQLGQCRSLTETKAASTMVEQAGSQLAALTRRVACELTGGRWLWRSGVTNKGGWVPWEVEVVNAAPDCFIWKKNTNGITTKVPGLYRCAVGFFTHQAVLVQICVNGEPILSLEPTDPDNPEHRVTYQRRYSDEDRYILRRSRHSAGEVTSLALDEFVALPPRAVISVRFECSEKAQGFLLLNKL